jgi:hypothetical protein
LNLSVDLFDFAIPPGTPNPTQLAIPSGNAAALKQFIGPYPQGNVKYTFSSSVLTPDEFSTILLFTSPFGPVWAPSSAVLGQHTTSTELYFALPTPTPEPTTLTLAALAIVCLLMAAHRRRRTR